MIKTRFKFEFFWIFTICNIRFWENRQRLINRQSCRFILNDRQCCRNSGNPVFSLRITCRLSHLIDDTHVHRISNYRNSTAIPNQSCFKEELYGCFETGFYGNCFVQKNRLEKKRFLYNLKYPNLVFIKLGC